MSQSQATLNRIWAQTMLEELSRLGVRHVCIAPGSRSTPLALEAKAQSKFTLHRHFDERGLGFLALGIAKRTAQPVAVIVTSGTAVANLLPATAEAGLTREKLVLLTSDRPVELVGCGANQAIDQLGIFSTHVTRSLALPSPSISVPLAWLLTSVDDALHQQARLGGAVQINCPYPEPLYSDNDRSAFAAYLKPLERWQQSGVSYTAQTALKDCLPALSAEQTKRRGLIILGSVSLHEAQQGLALAQRLGWPVLCDPQSGVGSPWAHFDLWMQHAQGMALLEQTELVIQLGSRLLSKRLNQWLAKQLLSSDVEYLYVSPHAQRDNPAHLPQTHLHGAIRPWLEQCLVQLPERLPAAVAPQYGWADALKPLAAQIGQLAVGDGGALSEISVARQASKLPNHVDVFVGNSLFVRLLDMFAVWPGLQVFSNRGASGIDGLIATAAGVQRGHSQPMVVFIGDTSLLYDLNSLALLRSPAAPVVVVVLNNDGGAIFDLLPVPAQQRVELYQMPHGLNFEHAAKQFELDYYRPSGLADYQHAVDEHLRAGQGTLVIEVVTPPEQAATQITQVVSQIHAL